MRVVSGSQSLQSAIDSANSGDKIFIHTSYNGTGDVLLASIDINKKIFIDGLGNNSVIQKPVNFQVGASKSRCHHIKFADDITVSDTVVDMILTDAWIANSKTITDNNTSSTANLYILIEET
jgi:hypothetical protein